MLQKIAAEHGPNGREMEEVTAQLEAANNAAGPDMYADERMRAAALAGRDDVPRHGEFPPASYGEPTPPPMAHQRTSQVSAGGSSFSPFSPDAGSYAQNQASQRHNGAWNYYGSRDGSEGVSPVESDTVKASTRPSSAVRYGPFLNGSPPSASTNRTPVRAEAPISRPTSSNPTPKDHNAPQWDPMHDLNGTLASLDLDRPWKSPAQSSESSGTSVQFRLNMETSP